MYAVCLLQERLYLRALFFQGSDGKQSWVTAGLLGRWICAKKVAGWLASCSTGG